MNDFGMDSSKATPFSEPAEILRRVHSKMDDMAPWALSEPTYLGGGGVGGGGKGGGGIEMQICR